MKENYEFEWAEAKDAANRSKHGVSFEEAEAIWDDPTFLEVHVTTLPEERWVVIDHVGKNAYLTAVITYRNEKVRIVSARKSSKKGVDAYGND